MAAWIAIFSYNVYMICYVESKHLALCTATMAATQTLLNDCQYEAPSTVTPVAISAILKSGGVLSPLRG